MKTSWKRSESKRIRSLPLKRGFPCSISAMMQPTDQMSTEKETRVIQLINTTYFIIHKVVTVRVLTSASHLLPSDVAECT